MLSRVGWAMALSTSAWFSSALGLVAPNAPRPSIRESIYIVYRMYSAVKDAGMLY